MMTLEQKVNLIKNIINDLIGFALSMLLVSYSLYGYYETHNYALIALAIMAIYNGLKELYNMSYHLFEDEL